jgi:hypothetical protein
LIFQFKIKFKTQKEFHLKAIYIFQAILLKINLKDSFLYMLILKSLIQLHLMNKIKIMLLPTMKINLKKIKRNLAIVLFLQMLTKFLLMNGKKLKNNFTMNLISMKENKKNDSNHGVR